MTTGRVQDIRENDAEQKKLQEALKQVAQLPFAVEPSDDLTAKFRTILEELELHNLLPHVEGASSVTMMSKLGAANEACTSKLSAQRQKLTRAQINLTRWNRVLQERKQRAKLRALERLDPEKCQQRKQMINKRRRMIWSRRTPKQNVKKRIKETFEDMAPVKRYRPKVSIQDRLEVVRWYNEQVKLVNPSVNPDEEQEQEQDQQEEKPRRKRKGQRKCRNKTYIKRGVNLLDIAMKRFPATVGPHTCLSRWSQAASRQKWEDLPESVRTANKEIPDSWKKAFGLQDWKGHQRLQKVPKEVLRSLDEHMVLHCQGLSEVTERNEEVLIHEIVVSSDSVQASRVLADTNNFTLGVSFTPSSFALCTCLIILVYSCFDICWLWQKWFTDADFIYIYIYIISFRV